MYFQYWKAGCITTKIKVSRHLLLYLAAFSEVKFCTFLVHICNFNFYTLMHFHKFGILCNITSLGGLQFTHIKAYLYLLIVQKVLYQFWWVVAQDDAVILYFTNHITYWMWLCFGWHTLVSSTQHPDQGATNSKVYIKITTLIQIVWRF